MGLERGPLSLVSTIEEILGRNISGSGLETREYGRRDLSRWPRNILYPQKVGSNFAHKQCQSVGIVRSRTRTTEFAFCFLFGFAFVSAENAVIHMKPAWISYAEVAK
jgi:hypothetical protein